MRYMSKNMAIWKFYNYLNKFTIIVKIKLIITQVIIGKKNVRFPDLKIMSPGNYPNPSFFYVRI